MTKQKPATPVDQLETALANIVYQHADWLTANDFLEAALQTAEAYFDDVTPSHVAAFRRAMLREVRQGRGGTSLSKKERFS